MLQYSSSTGTILNSLSVVVVLVVFIVDIRTSLAREKATKKTDVLKILVIFMLGSFLVGSLLAVAFSALEAYLLALVGCDMSWFVLQWSS